MNSIARTAPSLLLLSSLAACMTTSFADSVNVSLSVETESIGLEIRNTGQTYAEILDPQFEHAYWPPTGLRVRLRDLQGKLVLINGSDDNGWWSPRVLRSQLDEVPGPLLRLSPGEAVSKTLEVGNLLVGIQPRESIENGTCHFQARFTVYLSDRKTVVDSISSDWTPYSCDALVQN